MFGYAEMDHSASTELLPVFGPNHNMSSGYQLYLYFFRLVIFRGCPLDPAIGQIPRSVYRTEQLLEGRPLGNNCPLHARTCRLVGKPTV